MTSPMCRTARGFSSSPRRSNSRRPKDGDARNSNLPTDPKQLYIASWEINPRSTSYVHNRDLKQLVKAATESKLRFGPSPLPADWLILVPLLLGGAADGRRSMTGAAASAPRPARRRRPRRRRRRRPPGRPWEAPPGLEPGRAQ